MRPVRFCMVTTFYPPFNFGGDGIGIQRLSRALKRRGHHVTVIHDVEAFRMLSPRPLSLPQDDADGLDVHRLEGDFGKLSSLRIHQSGHPGPRGRRIEKILDDGQFDVINFHNVSLIGGPGVLALGGRNKGAGSGSPSNENREAARPLKAYMAHEHWLVCPTHVLWRHMREPCSGRQCLRCTLHYRRPPQLWRHTGLLGRQIENIDTFIAMSKFSRDKHREFGFPREMEVVPYFLPDLEEGAGVAAGTESRAPSDGPQVREASVHSRPFFLFVGRLEKLKGLDDVIPVFRRYGDADLLIAGDGEYGDALRRLAADVPQVHFLGRVPVDDLSAYYSQALALIVPSSGYETFGIIIIEAFRHGTPVIARRLGPFPEIVEAAGGGELFTTPDELATALGRLQHSKDARQRLGQAGQDAFGRLWSESAVVPRYLDVLRRSAEATGRTELAGRLETG